MIKLVLLYLTFLVGIVFLLPYNTIQYDLFLFSNSTTNIPNYFYYICEHLALIALAYIIASEATEYQQAIKIFFWLLVIDLIDFLLTYNGVWFTIQHFPITFNLVKIAIFGMVILKELWDRSTQQK